MRRAARARSARWHSSGRAPATGARQRREGARSRERERQTRRGAASRAEQRETSGAETEAGRPEQARREASGCFLCCPSRWLFWLVATAAFPRNEKSEILREARDAPCVASYTTKLHSRLVATVARSPSRNENRCYRSPTRSKSKTESWLRVYQKLHRCRPRATSYFPIPLMVRDYGMFHLTRP